MPLGTAATLQTVLCDSAGLRVFRIDFCWPKATEFKRHTAAIKTADFARLFIVGVLSKLRLLIEVSWAGVELPKPKLTNSRMADQEVSWLADLLTERGENKREPRDSKVA